MSKYDSIDPDIKDAIIKLNEIGVHTIYSGQGSGHGEERVSAYISINLSVMNNAEVHVDNKSIVTIYWDR